MRQTRLDSHEFGLCTDMKNSQAADLAWVEGNGRNRVQVTLEALPQGEPLDGRGLEHEVQERVFHL